MIKICNNIFGSHYLISPEKERICMFNSLKIERYRGGRLNGNTVTDMTGNSAVGNEMDCRFSERIAILLSNKFRDLTKQKI